MITDSIPKASIAMGPSNARDFAKKRRGNASAKLKQCKLDARREQWLSQVKGKSGHNQVINSGWSNGGSVCLENERSMSLGELELKRAVQEDIYGGGSPEQHYSDSESSHSNSPTSHSSSILGSHDSVLHFTASTTSSCRSGGSSSSSSSGCFSTSMSVEDDGDTGDEDCFDDWETMADALAATEVQQQEQEPTSFSGFDSHIEKHGSKYCSQIGEITLGSDISEKERRGTDLKRTHSDCRAWIADDAFRPQSLPSLSKQYSFPLNLEHRLGQGRSAWGSVNAGLVPTPCPICCEDLDGTDSSFIPCLCGFRLCLFCHKRILEDDGRCPGCRKQYDYLPAEDKATPDDGSLTFQ